MSGRVFDTLLLLIGALFVWQALHTPPENYDVMGPALWPLSVAAALVVLVLVSLFRSRNIAELPPITKRLGALCLLVAVFVGVQIADFVPFFLTAWVLLFLSYLAMVASPRPFEVICVSVALFAFAFGVQFLFTSVIYLDLQIGFDIGF